jgi:hypothetical protein
MKAFLCRTDVEAIECEVAGYKKQDQVVEEIIQQ